MTTAAERQHRLAPDARGEQDARALAADLLPACDFLAVMLGAHLASLLYAALFPAHGFVPAFWNPCEQWALPMAVLAPFLLLDRRLAATRQPPAPAAWMRTLTLRYAMFVGLVLGMGFVTRDLDTLPRAWMALWLGATFALAASARALAVRRPLPLRVAIVGAGPVADRLIQHLRRDPRRPVQIVGIYDDRASRLGGALFRPTGPVSDLVHSGAGRDLDWVLVTLPAAADRRVTEILEYLDVLAVNVGLCPQNVGLDMPCDLVDEVTADLPVMVLADRPIQRWNAVIKALEDFVLGGLIALFALPLMGLLALAIKLESPGPVFFLQKRHGWNNREFSVYKFRTMRTDVQLPPGELQQTLRNDPRITRVGRILRRTSLDEIPQILNVLRGEMSLVGPRPHATNMRTEDRLGHKIIATYAHRHRVKPGITGWAQVNGSRGATDTMAQLRRRVELDLQYIRDWSPWLDLKILFRTAAVVLEGENAF